MEKLIHRRDEDSYNPVVNINKLQEKRSGNLHSLHTFISKKHQKRILKKIFENDWAAFDKFINSIETVLTWKEAFEKIDIELARRRISVTNEDAVLLSNIIYRRYYPYDDTIKI